MFRKLALTDSENIVTFVFDGHPITATEGMSVAAALLSEGVKSIRKTPVSRSERGPFCMMGSCYDCMISIDGVTVQACQTLVSEGLVVSRIDFTDYTSSKVKNAVK